MKKLALMSSAVLAVSCNAMALEESNFDYARCHTIEAVKVASIDYDGIQLSVNSKGNTMQISRPSSVRINNQSFTDELLVPELWDKLDVFFELSRAQAERWKGENAHQKPTLTASDYAEISLMCESLFEVQEVEQLMAENYEGYQTIVNLTLSE